MSRPGAKPPRSAFADALLAGLARDGGLYLPESWPALSTETIRGFSGKSYADVAKAVLAPLVDGDIPEADLNRMIDEAYAGFRHPATCPLVQLDDNLFVLELFHGPTLAFKDVAMQLLGRLMDYVLRARGTRATIVGATSGDTGSAAVEAFQGPRSGRYLHPLSAWPRLGRAAASDDHGGIAERARARHRGHVRRLPIDGEGHVQSRPLSRRPAPVGRQFHQLGPDRRAGRVLLHRRRRSRGARPAHLVLGPDGQFRRYPGGLCRQAHGPPDRAADDRHQRQRHPGPDAGNRNLRDQGRPAHQLAFHGHPDLVQFRAAAIRGLRSGCRRGAGCDGEPRAIEILHTQGRALGPDPR